MPLRESAQEMNAATEVTMNESTTKKLSEILSSIDNTRDMENYMELPKVEDSFKSFPE